jgi:hypothetical protein
MSRIAAAALVLALPAAALADEEVYQFRTEEDATVSMDATACQGAPFRVNLRLVASVFIPVHSVRNGEVVVVGHRKVGTAVACAQLTDLTFPEGLSQNFYVHFVLPEGTFTGVGQCVAASNSVPKTGVVLAGCTLKLTEYPGQFVGGFVTSSSIFNPFGLNGFNTGSYWTLRAFKPIPRDGGGGPGHSGMQWVDDSRSDADIAAQSTKP